MSDNIVKFEPKKKGSFEFEMRKSGNSSKFISVRSEKYGVKFECEPGGGIVISYDDQNNNQGAQVVDIVSYDHFFEMAATMFMAMGASMEEYFKFPFYDNVEMYVACCTHVGCELTDDDFVWSIADPYWKACFDIGVPPHKAVEIRIGKDPSIKRK